MEIKQTQIDAALQVTLEHHDADDIHLSGEYRAKWGRPVAFSVTGSRGALEEFELYIAMSFVTPYLDDEVQAWSLLKSIMDIRELRHTAEAGYDDLIFFYPQFEVVK